MENVIRHNHNLVYSLSSKLMQMKDQIKEMPSSGKCDNYQTNEDEMKFTHDKRIGNANFGKWLHQKKVEKNMNAIEIENIKQVKLMNSRIQKKYEKLTMNEKNDENIGNDVNYNNLISQELFELCKINKYHREYSSQLIYLSFLLYRLSPSGFELLRKYLFIINDTLDEKLFPKLSFDALRTAQGLFQYLLNRNDTSHIVYNFNNWITSMSTYFPVTKKSVNPTCSVKIISRIINASKNEKVDQDLYDDDDESDDDTEENEDDQD
ncbi:hypothetical protein M9Y10_008462 [Tritrichomonas musculus]|uniref:Uncharacterized protein n=1 Tax=Tritrichomonas musculus TaxID=1915356 RepID=A0ABR2IYI9_9EUKA